MTTDAALSRKIDKGVFPGEQGGPHVHVFAALATTFKIAQSKTFADLQSQIIKNSSALTKQLQVRGMRIPFGGTNTHLANLDCKLIKGPDGTTLSGDMAARILDVAGIVLNRNTIPGDKTANNSSGIRFGTPWMTQRGLKEDDMVEVANIMVDLLQGCTPYSVETRKGLVSRAKVDFKVLEDAKKRVRTLCEKAGADLDFKKNGYPQFYYLDDQSGSKNELSTLKLSGPSLRQYVTYCFSSEVELLQAGQSQKTSLATPLGLIEGAIENVDDTSYRFSFPREKFGLAATFLRGLAEGYITFDKDIPRRIPGSVVVIEDLAAPVKTADALAQNHKPYFIGQNVTTGTPLPAFEWKDKESTELFRTTLYETHKKMGAKIIPFAGWEMPVWYTSVVEEHLACRQVAGLFDVSHMGVFQAEGIHAALFLETVCGNDINSLAVGESCYTHFLDPEANVIDDTLVYRRDTLKYLVVVNASNDAKDWAWLNAVREGKVMIESLRPWINTFGAGVTLRNLRDPKAGADMRVDIALQGPKSRDILLSLGCDASTQKKVKALKRTELCDAVIGGFDLVVSRTGYTGEKMAFELFVHPEKAAALWDAICEAGEPLGMKACGLGARDSLRTEAGLPLYGHEMGGKDNFSVSEAGFGSYVKIYKPW
ncbi:MAG: hypothetical protein ACD_34C00479G0001, partial [uncultured bacterium]